MEEKDKKSEFSIRTTFVKWLNIQGLQSALFLFGQTNVGKSTICHLTKRVIDNFQDPNLKLVQKKKDFEYEYEGELKGKFVKPMTIYPKVHKIEASKTNMIEVPSRIYQIERKRPCLDKILNIVGLSYVASRGKFLFCVDAKNTSGKAAEHWRKSFQTVFDYFRDEFFNENAYKSIGFVITKGESEYTNEVYLNRLPDIYEAVQKQPRKDIYLQILETVQTNKRIEVFNKITNEDGAHNSMKSISQLSEKLSYVNLQLQNDKKQTIIKMDFVELSKDEDILYAKFQETLEFILTFFAKMINKIFTSTEIIDIKAFLEQNSNFLQEIKKRISAEEEKEEGEICQVLKIKYASLVESSFRHKDFYQTALGRASLFVEFKQKIQNHHERTNKTLQTFLNILADHGLILEDFQTEMKQIYTELIIFQIFEQRFGPLFKSVNYRELLDKTNVIKQFRQEHEQIVKSDFLRDIFLPNPKQTPQGAMKIITIIDKLFPQNKIKGTPLQEEIELFKNTMMLSSFDTKNPNQNLSQILELIEKFINEKKLPQAIYQNQLPNPTQLIEFLNKLALIVAQMLKNYGRPDLCVQIFKDCGKFNSSKICLQIKLKEIKESEQKVNIETVSQTLISYINLLIEMSLSQKAIECCFQWVQRYQQISQKLWQKMQEIKSKQSQPFQKQLKRKFTRKGVELTSFYKNIELLAQIRIVVDNIKK